MRHMVGHRDQIVYHFAALPEPHSTSLVAEYEKARARIWSALPELVR